MGLATFSIYKSVTDDKGWRHNRPVYRKNEAEKLKTDKATCAS